MPGRHPPHRLACAEKAADDVGGEHTLPAARRHVFHAHLGLEDAGVVDQRRDPTERSVEVLEKPNHIGFDADVAGDRERLAAAALYFVNDALGRITIALVVRHTA